jgi:SMI1 / KNR4 family (SUKH-1)
MKNVEDLLLQIGGVTNLCDEANLPVSEEQIQSLEKHLKFSFSDSFKYFLKNKSPIMFRNTVSIKSISYKENAIYYNDEDVYPDIIYGFSKEKLSLDIINNIETYTKRMPNSLIPVGTDGSGNQICLGISDEESGKIFFWDHENECMDGFLNENKSDIDKYWNNIYFLANNFDEFLSLLEIHD